MSLFTDLSAWIDDNKVTEISIVKTIAITQEGPVAQYSIVTNIGTIGATSDLQQGVNALLGNASNEASSRLVALEAEKQELLALLSKGGPA